MSKLDWKNVLETRINKLRILLYIQSLIKADELGLKSIAFPSLTSGVFGFPRETCAEIIINKTVE